MIDVNPQSAVPMSLLALLGDDLNEAILDDVAALARAKWIRLAQTELTSSKRDYIAGIQEIGASKGLRWIELVGQVPNMVEQGWPVTDLRTTLLGDGKGKQAADGHRYRAIPFRHGTPGSKGQAGTPMGARYGPVGGSSRAHQFDEGGGITKGAAFLLGQQVYAQAKRLRGGKSTPGRTIVDMGAGRKAMPLLAPHHSTDIFAGMRRTQKQYKTATQGQYTTFRMISEANPNGWMHPGITARNLAQKVEASIGEMLDRVVVSAVRSAIGRGGLA